MSEPITSELRDAMNVDREYTMGGDVVARTYCMGRDEFIDLCDAIDSVHANLERENESLRRELDRVLGEEHDFAPESHYMMLPKDADGVPIHVGDTMAYYAEVREVTAVGSDCFVAWNSKDGRYHQYDATSYTHRTPDSWERIIADAAATRCDFDDLVARCRALAGDAE